MYIYYALDSLKEKRLEKGFSQESISGLVRTTFNIPFKRAYYAHIETGRRATTPEVVAFISKILDMKIDELFTTEKPKNETAVKEETSEYVTPESTNESNEHIEKMPSDSSDDLL